VAYMPDTLLNIVRAGGGLDIDLAQSSYMPETLQNLAMVAARHPHRPRIIFRNCSLMPDTMQKIALVGQGCVIFAF
jgi:hypothetical protein